MNTNQPDIKLIQKYLNGELDAKAMHALEKQAQSDPFLMDAIEGYQETGRDQQPNFTDVQNRFAKRTVPSEPKRNIVLWRAMPVAATILILLSIGFLWLSPKKDEQVHNRQVYNKMVKIPAPVVGHAKPDTAVKHTTVQVANAQVSPVQAEKAHHIKASHTEQFIASHSLPRKQVDTGKKASIETALAGMVPSLDILRGNNQGSELLRHSVKFQNLSGTVTDATGHGLAGVKLAVKGTRQTAVTDSTGAFTLTTTDSMGTINIAYAGYDKKEVDFGHHQKLNITLNESANTLAMVTVPGHEDSEPALGIHPAEGWKAFSDYIKKNAFMPDGSTGRVKLAFLVGSNGLLKNIRVIRGKSPAMNEKAIALLMNGPQWTGTSEAKEFRLKIRFRKPKTT